MSCSLTYLIEDVARGVLVELAVQDNIACSCMIKMSYFEISYRLESVVATLAMASHVMQPLDGVRHIRTNDVNLGLQGSKPNPVLNVI